MHLKPGQSSGLLTESGDIARLYQLAQRVDVVKACFEEVHYTYLGLIEFYNRAYAETKGEIYRLWIESPSEGEKEFGKRLAEEIRVNTGRELRSVKVGPGLQAIVRIAGLGRADDNYAGEIEIAGRNIGLCISRIVNPRIYCAGFSPQSKIDFRAFSPGFENAMELERILREIQRELASAGVESRMYFGQPVF